MLIAKRALKLAVHGGERTIEIRLFTPSRAGTEPWSCRYEIDWPHGRRAAAGSGIDSMQALVLTLQMIGADIYCSEYHRSGKLRWKSAGRGYGFPVPSTLQDLLVGDDARGARE